MAVDLCHDVVGSWAGGAAGFAGSPRLSFSRDLPAGDHPEGGGVERADAALLPLLGSPSSEFEFGMCAASPSSSVGGAAAADELFADGMLLPIPIQSKKQKPKQQAEVGAAVVEVVPSTTAPCGAAPPPPPPPPPPKETLKEIMAVPNPEDVEADAKKPGRLSFWRFSRSCSVSGTGIAGSRNSGSGSSSSRHGGLFFSLPLLRRTKSAGSEPSPTPASAAAVAPKTQQHRRSAAHAAATTTTKAKNGTNPKPNPTPRRKSNAGGAPRPPSSSSSSSTSSSSSASTSSATAAASSSSSSSYYYGPCHIGSASGGMRISPVINVPPACVHRSGSTGSGAGGVGSGFLGLGHLFLCSGGKKSFITAEQ